MPKAIVNLKVQLEIECKTEDEFNEIMNTLELKPNMEKEEGVLSVKIQNWFSGFDWEAHRRIKLYEEAEYKKDLSEDR